MRGFLASAALAALFFGCGPSEKQADGGLINGRNVNLTSIEVSDGSLFPSFTQVNTGYNADFPESVESVTVKPKAADRNALITVNGQSVGYGGSSGKIALLPGKTVLVEITVRSPEGDAEKKYTVAAFRAGRR